MTQLLFRPIVGRIERVASDLNKTARQGRWRLLGPGVALLTLVVFSADPALLRPARAVGDGVPRFAVDPDWPKPLPHDWLLGQVGGLAVDGHDHVWVLQRPRSLTPDEAGATQSPPRSQCCAAAPPVLEFDADGNLLQGWGGPPPAGAPYQWPSVEHGIRVRDDGVWIAGSGKGDDQVLKFTRQGRFLMRIGARVDCAASPPWCEPHSLNDEFLGQPAAIDIDDGAHEIYVADGYLNRRVIVFDTETATVRRLWGAYGKPPCDRCAPTTPYRPGDPPDTQFRTPVHDVRLSRDRLVYVADRVNDRLQVYRRDGTFVNEFAVRPTTLGNGSVWGVEFSRDPDQTYLYVVDGENNVIWILRRGTGEVVASIGRSGRNAGQFHWVHVLAADSKGNLYTGEVDTGKRVQKFKYLGP